MTAGRYKHASDALGKARQTRARVKRVETRAAMLARRKEQRATQRALKAQPPARPVRG